MKKYKADLVEKDDGYETPGRRKDKKGSDKPVRRPKHSKPKTVANSKVDIKGEARMQYWKSKGFKTDPHPGTGAYKASKNKFKG